MIINFASSPNHYKVTDQIWMNSESIQSVFQVLLHCHVYVCTFQNRRISSRSKAFFLQKSDEWTYDKNFASSPNHYEVTDQIWVNSESFQSIFQALQNFHVYACTSQNRQISSYLQYNLNVVFLTFSELHVVGDHNRWNPSQTGGSQLQRFSSRIRPFAGLRPIQNAPCSTQQYNLNVVFLTFSRFCIQSKPL